jgi:glycosyltransferase involved in cell wall biosynthesis
VLEGMIFRKPVIATNHGGPMESIVDGVSGFLIPPEKPRLLADKIIFLMENEDIAKEVGENARKHVEEKFSVEGNIQKIEGVYASLLET